MTPNVVLQLHRDLFQFAPDGGGHWKSTDNDIMERRPDGTSVVPFKPVAPHLTTAAMDRLGTEFSATYRVQRDGRRREGGAAASDSGLRARLSVHPPIRRWEFHQLSDTT